MCSTRGLNCLAPLLGEPFPSRETGSALLRLASEGVLLRVHAAFDPAKRLGARSRMVRAEGLEPPQLSSLEPKSSASTSSATPADSIKGPAAMPERDAEKCAAVFGWPSCSKPLKSITFMILGEPHPTSSRSVRRAYNMGPTVRSKKMAVLEPAGAASGNGSHPGGARVPSHGWRPRTARGARSSTKPQKVWVASSLPPSAFALRATVDAVAS